MLPHTSQPVDVVVGREVGDVQRKFVGQGASLHTYLHIRAIRAIVVPTPTYAVVAVETYDGATAGFVMTPLVTPSDCYGVTSSFTLSAIQRDNPSAVPISFHTMLRDVDFKGCSISNLIVDIRCL